MRKRSFVKGSNGLLLGYARVSKGDVNRVMLCRPRPSVPPGAAAFSTKLHPEALGPI